MWIRSADDTTEAKFSPGSPRSETTTEPTGSCPTPNTTNAATNHYQQDEPPDTTTTRRFANTRYALVVEVPLVARITERGS
jgi:hypothetical protein